MPKQSKVLASVSAERVGSRDYPTHDPDCGCSGCYRSNVSEAATTTGYLSAVDVMIVVSHDYQTARLVLREGGFTRDEVALHSSGETRRRLLLAWDDHR